MHFLHPIVEFVKLVKLQLLLCCLLANSLLFTGFAQTSHNTTPHSTAGLNQYMWSFSKNSPKPGEKALVDFEVMDNWRENGGASNYLSSVAAGSLGKGPRGSMNLNFK